MAWLHLAPETLFFLGGMAVLAALLWSLSGRGVSSAVAPMVAIFFAALSAVAVASGGPLGFFAEHTRSLWSSQIWFDLLIAAFFGWLGLLPRARAQKMRIALWALLIPLAGSLGLLVLYLRIRWLESRSQ